MLKGCEPSWVNSVSNLSLAKQDVQASRLLGRDTLSTLGHNYPGYGIKAQMHFCNFLRLEDVLDSDGTQQQEKSEEEEWKTESGEQSGRNHHLWT